MDHSSNRFSLPAEPREFGFYVNGGWRQGAEMLTRLSPAHGVAVTRVPKCSLADLNEAVAAARTAFEDRRWSGLPGAARAFGAQLPAAGVDGVALDARHARAGDELAR